MTALFTTAAIERIREMAVDPQEKADLSALLSIVDAASTSADLVAALPGTVRVAKRSDAEVFVVRQGRLRAVVTVDPKKPNRMIIASVNRADDDTALPDLVASAHDLIVPN